MRIRAARLAALAAFASSLPGLCASAQSATVGEPVVLGQRYPLRSERMGEPLSYQVHRPANYDFSNARYPVLIVLHGDQFQHVSTTMDVLAAAGKIPEMLVVGVRSTDNVRDEIPQAAISEHPPKPPTRGGPAKFLKFITDELIPEIDHDYRTRPYRVLVGHSTAGLFQNGGAELTKLK
jgi:predicted alpha/beta superfamily hydrolase